MKWFKRLMTALLAAVLAVGMLAGCSGAPAAPNTPLPSDAEALALYQGAMETCEKYNVKTPVYCAELDEVAKNFAERAVIKAYYNDTKEAEAKAKEEVAVLADGAEYINCNLNPYDKAVKNPLSTSTLKNDILQKGANRVGFAVLTLKNGKGEDEKYVCTVYARFPDAAAQE